MGSRVDSVEGIRPLSIMFGSVCRELNCSRVQGKNSSVAARVCHDLHGRVSNSPKEFVRIFRASSSGRNSSVAACACVCHDLHDRVSNSPKEFVRNFRYAVIWITGRTR